MPTLRMMPASSPPIDPGSCCAKRARPGTLTARAQVIQLGVAVDDLTKFFRRHIRLQIGTGTVTLASDVMPDRPSGTGELVEVLIGPALGIHQFPSCQCSPGAARRAAAPTLFFHHWKMVSQAVA